MGVPEMHLRLLEPPLPFEPITVVDRIIKIPYWRKFSAERDSSIRAAPWQS